MGESFNSRNSYSKYLKSANTRWYWIFLGLTFLCMIIVILIPVDQNPVLIFRLILGSILILFLPGYSMLKMLFSNKTFNSIEIATLSIGFSLALTPIVVLLLNYTDFGITQNSIVIGITLLNTIFASIGVIKNYTLTNREEVQ